MPNGTYSLELFPPRTEKTTAALPGELKKMAALNPAFFSVTFGAGGTTRDGTFETVSLAMRETGLPAAPHISCIDSTREGLRALLNQYREAGITRLVALRGDVIEGQTATGELNYANELVAFIRAEHGNHFTIEVAAYPEAHPETAHPDRDLDNFQRKVEAGADSAITQYFYNIDAFDDFVDRARGRGIELPIVPGVMPITNFKQLARFSDICGAEIPLWIRKRLEAHQDDLDYIRDFGTDVVTRLCQRLLERGVPGMHFYTLNRAEPTASIWKNLEIA